MLLGAVRFLENSLSRRPLTTNCILYGSLSGLAEFSQQTVIKEKEKYNVKTVGHYTLLGGGVFGPVIHFWYRWLDRVLPGTAARTIAKKVALDISVFAVPYYTTFYLSLNFLSGSQFQESFSELKLKLIPTILTSTAFWLPAQTVNFRFVRPRYRVLYLAGCTFIEFNILAVFKRLDSE